MLGQCHSWCFVKTLSPTNHHSQHWTSKFKPTSTGHFKTKPLIFTATVSSLTCHTNHRFSLRPVPWVHHAQVQRFQTIPLQSLPSPYFSFSSVWQTLSLLFTLFVSTLRDYQYHFSSLWQSLSFLFTLLFLFPPACFSPPPPSPSKPHPWSHLSGIALDPTSSPSTHIHDPTWYHCGHSPPPPHNHDPTFLALLQTSSPHPLSNLSGITADILTPSTPIHYPTFLALLQTSSPHPLPSTIQPFWHYCRHPHPIHSHPLSNLSGITADILTPSTPIHYPTFLALLQTSSPPSTPIHDPTFLASLWTPHPLPRPTFLASLRTSWNPAPPPYFWWNSSIFCNKEHMLGWGETV